LATIRKFRIVDPEPGASGDDPPSPAVGVPPQSFFGIFDTIIPVGANKGEWAMDPTLERIVDFLNKNKIRASYGAVADAAGVPARSVGRLLGHRRPWGSWVVNKATGEPTGYVDHEKDADLHVTNEIITKGADLILRMKRES
jgi:alkylated DNA nucleotide flippase Atl1